jgi:hypothetical protein
VTCKEPSPHAANCPCLTPPVVGSETLQTPPVALPQLYCDGKLKLAGTKVSVPLPRMTSHMHPHECVPVPCRGFAMLAVGRTADTAQSTTAIFNEFRHADSIFMIVSLATPSSEPDAFGRPDMTGRAEPFDYIRRALTGRSAFATGPNETFKPTCAE